MGPYFYLAGGDPEILDTHLQIWLTFQHDCGKVLSSEGSELRG